MSALLRKRPSMAERRHLRLVKALRLHRRRLPLKMLPCSLPVSTLTGKRLYLKSLLHSNGMLRIRLPVEVTPMSMLLRRRYQALRVVSP